MSTDNNVITFTPQSRFKAFIQKMSQGQNADFLIYPMSDELSVNWQQMDTDERTALLAYLAVGYEMAGERGFYLATIATHSIYAVGIRELEGEKWHYCILDEAEVESMAQNMTDLPIFDLDEPGYAPGDIANEAEQSIADQIPRLHRDYILSQIKANPQCDFFELEEYSTLWDTPFSRERIISELIKLHLRDSDAPFVILNDRHEAVYMAAIHAGSCALSQYELEGEERRMLAKTVMARLT